MMHVWFLAAWFIWQNPSNAVNASNDQTTAAVVDAVLASGRCADLAQPPSERVSTKPTIAPGLPPLLSFRYYEGQQHHRFGNTDLVLDDAGH